MSRDSIAKDWLWCILTERSVLAGADTQFICRLPLQRIMAGTWLENWWETKQPRLPRPLKALLSRYCNVIHFRVVIIQKGLICRQSNTKLCTAEWEESHIFKELPAILQAEICYEKTHDVLAGHHMFQACNSLLWSSVCCLSNAINHAFGDKDSKCWSHVL